MVYRCGAVRLNELFRNQPFARRCDETITLWRFLAENIPELNGGTVLDIGTGSGALAIVALLRGAQAACLTDVTTHILEAAKSNVLANTPQSKVRTHLATDDNELPISAPDTVELILCNPASLPLPPSQKHQAGAYYAGDDGRAMIDRLITESASLVQNGAKLLLAHTSLADVAKTHELVRSLSLHSKVLAEKTLQFRPFYDREWIDNIGGQSKDLYHTKDGQAFEILQILEIS